MELQPKNALSLGNGSYGRDCFQKTKPHSSLKNEVYFTWLHVPPFVTSNVYWVTKYSWVHGVSRRNLLRAIFAILLIGD
jgi:hypothetical protein